MEATLITKRLLTDFNLRYPREVANVLGENSPGEVLDYLRKISLDNATEIFLGLHPELIGQVLDEMDDAFFKLFFPAIDAYAGSIILSRLSSEEVEKRLKLLPEKVQHEIKELMNWPPESAGFLMDTRIILFKSNDTVEVVLEKIRSLKDRQLMNIHVVDNKGAYKGIIPIQHIAIASPGEKLNKLVEKTITIHAMSPQDEVVEILKDRKIINLPVVDLDEKLLGVIRYDTLVSAAQKDATEDVQAIFGAGREERALSKVSFAIKKRLPWLEINLATAFLAASVVGLFEETIAQITVLAVFLPVVAGQSGNTGSQALAVTIRGLALREIRSSHWMQVARKEVMVGLINGIAVASTTALIVYFWTSSFGLALVIGVSMVFSMVIAGFSGAVIPIVLKSLGQDPAQSSSIVLTTVTDVVGFLSFLGLATTMSTMIGIS